MSLLDRPGTMFDLDWWEERQDPVVGPDCVLEVQGLFDGKVSYFRFQWSVVRRWRKRVLSARCVWEQCHFLEELLLLP